MTRYVMLTQDDCPNCERLKLMLSKPLKGQFDDQIEQVHRQHQPDRFMELTEAYKLQTTPVLIDLEAEKILTNTNALGEVKPFLMGEGR